MDDKEKNLQDIIDCGVVAIVRVGSAQEAVEVCGAIAKGGVKPIEVTMTVPGAIDAIKEFKSAMKGEVLVGAGTVLDPETARAVILAGAEFVVSPNLNLKVIEVCHRYGKIVIPGTLTPTEILTAWEAGADIVKVFPAGALGPRYFIRAGAVAVSVGTSLVDRKAVSERRYDIITENARKFVEAVRLARVG